MKATRNRTKLLRVHCGMCNAQQDSLRMLCSSCGKPLYSNMNAEELEGIRTKVEEIDSTLASLDMPSNRKGNPYQPYDDADALIRQLRPHAYLPGMKEYLADARLVVLPYRIRLMENTMKANIVFSVILFGFSGAPLLMGWPAMIALIMALPAVVWLGITLKARSSLLRARAELKAGS